MNDSAGASPPTVASFFAGIGGFDLGFDRAGLRTVWQCEIDPFCRDILHQHWPDLPRPADIRGLKPEDVPDADVWAGGFPCQDVSLARMGPRKGLRGAQSGLFFEFARLVRERLPNVVVIENVPGLLSSHGGRDFGIVTRTLADLGYGLAWRVLNSRYFGVPQSRPRVFVVACHRDARRAGEILFDAQRGDGDAPASKPHGQATLSPFKTVLGDTVKGPLVPAIAYCLYANRPDTQEQIGVEPT